MPGANLYLALGDSITTGYGVGLEKSFATLCYGYMKKHGKILNYNNFGINGLTSAELVNFIRENRKVRNSLAQAQIITLTIGSNDVLSIVRQGRTHAGLNPVLHNFQQNLGRAGSFIRAVNPSVALYAATIYNPLPAGPFMQYSKQAQAIIDQANAVIAAWAGSYNFRLVQIDRVFRGHERALVGMDYIHPNQYGHQVIAEAFTHVIEKSIRYQESIF